MKLTEEHLDSIARELIPLLGEVVDMVETGGVALPEDERLTWAIQGQAVMVTSIPEPRRDGSYRIVLSSSENWVLKSVLTSGLDSLTEIEVILAPRIS